MKITKAEIKTEDIKLKRDKELQKFKMEIASQDIEWEVSFLERLNVWLQYGLKLKAIIKIIDFFFTIIGVVMNNDKSTSILGYIKGSLFVVVGGLFLAGLVPEALLETLGDASGWTGIGAVLYGIIDMIFGNKTNKKDKDENAGNDNG